MFVFTTLTKTTSSLTSQFKFIYIGIGYNKSIKYSVRPVPVCHTHKRNVILLVIVLCPTVTSVRFSQ
jgi:hypothetical protein